MRLPHAHAAAVTLDLALGAGFIALLLARELRLAAVAWLVVLVLVATSPHA